MSGVTVARAVARDAPARTPQVEGGDHAPPGSAPASAAPPDRSRRPPAADDPLCGVLSAAVQQRRERALRPPLVAGSALLQRTLRVAPIDYDPKTGNYHRSEINAAGFVAMLRGSAFWNALTDKEQARLEAIDGANLSAPDIPQLADLILPAVVLQPDASLKKGPLKRAQERRALIFATHRPAVEGALVKHAPQEVNERELVVFKKLLDVATVKSRAKGVPSQVAIANLPDENVALAGFAESKMQTAVRAFVAALTRFNTALGTPATYHGMPPTTPGARAEAMSTDVRTPHQNRSGWLPVHASANPLPGLDARADAWARRMVADAHPLFGPQITAAFPALAGGTAVTAAQIEASALPPVVKRRFYGDVFRAPAVTGAPLARHAWKQFADGHMAGCPYIEFTSDHAGGISRYVWDFVNDTLYIGTHYKWVEGYTPFFEVTGKAATI